MDLLPFAISQTIRTLLNPLWSPKAGLLVDPCFDWSYDLCDHQVAPWLTESRAPVSVLCGGGSELGVASRCLPGYCFADTALPTPSLSWGSRNWAWWVMRNAVSLPILCKDYSPKDIALWCWGFCKPQPKLRKWFIKIKKRQGKAAPLCLQNISWLFTAFEERKQCHSWGTQHYRSLVIGKIINIAGILLHFEWENWKVAGKRFCLQVQAVLTRGKSANQAVPAGLCWHIFPRIGLAEAWAPLARWLCIILCI